MTSALDWLNEAESILEKYKADLASATDLITSLEGAPDANAAKAERLAQMVQNLAAENANVSAGLSEKTDESFAKVFEVMDDVLRSMANDQALRATPVAIERDEDGRMIAIGGRVIHRDDNGLVEGID